MLRGAALGTSGLEPAGRGSKRDLERLAIGFGAAGQVGSCPPHACALNTEVGRQGDT